MRAAGYRGPDIFSAGAVKLIGSASHGLMRRVNILADKALLAAFVANTHNIDAQHVQAAIRDSELAPMRKNPRTVTVLGGIVVATLILAGAGRPLIRQYISPPAEPQNSHAATQSPAISAGALAAVPASASAPVTTTLPANPTNTLSTTAPSNLPPLLTQRLDAAREVLSRRDKNGASIQLYYTEDVRPVRMEHFLECAKKLGVLEKIYVLPIRIKGKQGFRVLYGSYPDIDSARASIKYLPKRYRNAFAPTLYFSETEPQNP
jgi:MSHA biogenesis protein MshM